MPDKEVFAAQANRGGQEIFFEIEEIQEDVFRVGIDSRQERKMSIDLPGSVLEDALQAVHTRRAL